MSLKPLLLDIGQDGANKEINEMELDSSDISPISHDSDFGDLVAADENGSIVSDQINDETDADIALETIANYLTQSLNSGANNVHTLSMANVAIESIFNKINIGSDKLAFSMEDYRSNPSESIKVALEDIKEKAAAIWASVKEKITLLAKFLGEKMNYFKRNLSNMRADISRLEKTLNLIDVKTEAKAKFLKPQNWFIDLMYSDKGMPTGLEGVGKAVEELLRDHRKMAMSSIGKYTKWLIANYKQAESDSNVFSSLKVNKDEFLLSGAKEFNRSIGLKRPVGENMFYRGKELPGNKAFYTQVRPKDKVGISSIGTIADVGFGIYSFDPQSYKLKMMTIAKIVAAGSIPWCLGVAAVTTTALTAGALGTAYGIGLGALINKAKVEGTGTAIHIDKDMIFKTLTLQEAKKVIADLKNGAKALQDWYTDIFETNWKQAELDRIINDVTGLDRVQVNNNSSFRALKRYCMALLNLMNSTTIGTHVYAFKTYGAMINYCDKSLRQYK